MDTASLDIGEALVVGETVLLPVGRIHPPKEALSSTIDFWDRQSAPKPDFKRAVENMRRQSRALSKGTPMVLSPVPFFGPGVAAHVIAALPQK